MPLFTYLVAIIILTFFFKNTGLVKVSVLEHFMFFAYLYNSCTVSFNVNKNKIKKIKKNEFKSNEHIHKKEDGSYYVLSANEASLVTL